MQALEFLRLLTKTLNESSSYGGLEITANGGFQTITGVSYCGECLQFHVESEPSEAAKEIMGEVGFRGPAFDEPI